MDSRYNAGDRDGGHIELHIDMYEGGALAFSETIRERVHEVEAVCGLLRENGFELLQCADRLLLGSGNHGTTWFIAAQKAYI